MLLQVAALAVRVTAVGFAAVKFAAKRDSEFDEVTAAPFLASIGALRTDADDAAAAHGRALDNAASAAAVLLASGQKGKRLALPHARILIHQPYAGAQGQASDIELIAAEIQRMKSSLEEVLAYHTGQPVEKISADTDRDFVMTATEAKDYGIIDEVIDSRNVVDNSGPITAIS